MMLGSMMHVQPVMSLDAAHLKTTGGGGILYMASVKSASNDLYPVAVAITVDNENNKEGWIWFLESLQATLPILEQPHPKEGVAYNRFTFISDPQKGLIEALKVVFPNNHSCYCAVHIARNVGAKFGGPQQAKYVILLSKTFSMTEAEQLLQAMSRRVREYVAEIEEPQWRSTAWLVDEALPPRYGIVTSNMSESLNSMFERARDVHWKHTIQIILSKMVERIAELSQKYEGKEGVIDEVVCRLQYYWQEHCAGLVVVPMKDSAQTLFTVFTHSGGVVDENVAGHNMNVATRSCDCGLWQEHEYPCIHAAAYYKKHLQFNFDQVLNEVDRKYTYESEKLLFSRNFLSVCNDRIVGDKSILTPCFKQKKAGRMTEIRKKRGVIKPDSRVGCSRCKQKKLKAKSSG
jgi:MULE transposase domain/SWIM zinc finger